MPQLAMTIEPYAHGVRIGLDGELDMACAYTFDTQLREVEEREPRLIVLDMRGLSFIDSAGVARIVAAHRRARREGRRVVLTRGTRPIQRILSFGAIDDMLEVVPEPEAALA